MTVEATTRPGKGAREPGTGIALWYTRATRAGAFYGAAERWDGVGVVLDTSERRVLVLRNDGTHTGGTVLGSCAANVPYTAQVRLRVRSDHVAHTFRVDVALHPRAPWFACWRGAVALPPLLKLGVTASSRNAPFLVHSLTLGHSEPEDETNLRTLRQDETKMFALADKAADATAARLARATAGLCHVALEVAALAGAGESHDAALSEAVFVIPFVSLGLLGEVILLVDGHRTKGTEEMVQSVETSFGQAHEVLKGRFAALEQHAVNALAPLL